MKNVTKLSLTLLSAAVITACGGSGGGGEIVVQRRPLQLRRRQTLLKVRKLIMLHKHQPKRLKFKLRNLLQIPTELQTITQ